jgi:hypothetical protein
MLGRRPGHHFMRLLISHLISGKPDGLDDDEDVPVLGTSGKKNWIRMHHQYIRTLNLRWERSVDT